MAKAKPKKTTNKPKRAAKTTPKTIPLPRIRLTKPKNLEEYDLSNKDLEEANNLQEQTTKLITTTNRNVTNKNKTNDNKTKADKRVKPQSDSYQLTHRDELLERVEDLLVKGYTEIHQIAKQLNIHAEKAGRLVNIAKERSIIRGGARGLLEVRGDLLASTNLLKKQHHLIIAKNWKTIETWQQLANDKKSSQSNMATYKVNVAYRIINQSMAEISKLDKTISSSFGLNTDQINNFINLEVNNGIINQNTEWTAPPEQQIEFENIENDIMDLMYNDKGFLAEVYDN